MGFTHCYKTAVFVHLFLSGRIVDHLHNTTSTAAISTPSTEHNSSHEDGLLHGLAGPHGILASSGTSST